MNEHLLKINSIIEQLDGDTLSALEAVSKIKTYKKGDFLLYQGEVCRYSFWIESGIARKFYLNENKELTTELLFENDLAVAFSSYVTQQPSQEFIQAVTDVRVSSIDNSSFQRIKGQFSALMELDLLMTEYYTMWLEKDFLIFIHLMLPRVIHSS
ncbi:cyclic nucleotide-binding domain-containing protein [Sphingobacterium sp. E70]|uniref:Crp/Fnr family transcriptional regulator n=1 Tax=Sphingobacterium sp. E70 TaxID=2853439 RepID=UPI00211CC60F|nr:cyclic nucleotide-binding domain-containing protein [Sphingobacterium sp. E70]ULT24196.1 cyclic nucleotide-binding domain-containing protein [Sphingobacterium sp. E70]